MTKTSPLNEKEKILADLAKIEAAERVSHETQRECNGLLQGVETATQRLELAKSKLAEFHGLIEGQLKRELETIVTPPLENFLQMHPGNDMRLPCITDISIFTFGIYQVNKWRFADGETRYIVPLANALEAAKSAFEKFREDHPSVVPGVEPNELKQLIKP